MAGEIAASRDMDPAKIRGLIDGAPYAAGEALQAGLLDKLAYWDETGTHFGTDASYLSLKEYADAQDGEDEVDESAVRVALIQGSGPIVLAGNDFGGFADDTAIQANPMAQAISDAIDDPDISAILLRLNSPGGSYVASDTIRREVERAGAEGVPVVVSMGNVAASGGYFIAASAAKIVAQPTTITGSIGVVGGKFVLDGLWRELEIGHASIKAGRNADFWSPNQAFSPEAAASFENLLDRTYNDFMAKVAEGRGLSPEQVHELAKGQVWSGADAKASGLVDALGGFDTALDLIRIEAAIDADAKIRLEAYPAPRDPFTAMIEDFFGASAELGAFAKAVKGIARLAQAMAALDPARHVLSDGQKSLQTRAPEMRLP
jgi:protease-4